MNQTTKVENYERKNSNGYVSSQKLTSPAPHEENKDILKELEDYGIKITTK